MHTYIHIEICNCKRTAVAVTPRLWLWYTGKPQQRGDFLLLFIFITSYSDVIRPNRLSFATGAETRLLCCSSAPCRRASYCMSLCIFLLTRFSSFHALLLGAHNLFHCCSFKFNYSSQSPLLSTRYVFACIALAKFAFRTVCVPVAYRVKFNELLRCAWTIRAESPKPQSRSLAYGRRRRHIFWLCGFH